MAHRKWHWLCITVKIKLDEGTVVTTLILTAESKIVPVLN
jgi:hypothetical protein